MEPLVLPSVSQSTNTPSRFELSAPCPLPYLTHILFFHNGKCHLLLKHPWGEVQWKTSCDIVPVFLSNSPLASPSSSLGLYYWLKSPKHNKLINCYHWSHSSVRLMPPWQFAVTPSVAPCFPWLENSEYTNRILSGHLLNFLIFPLKLFYPFLPPTRWQAH